MAYQAGLEQLNHTFCNCFLFHVMSRELAWLHFVLPGLLIGYSGFMSSESHLIRLNEYMYHQLSNNVPLAKDQEECVFGAIALLIDVGSNENPEIAIDFLEEVLYDLFPGLEAFLRLVEPNQAPFTTAILDLTRLSDFMTSIQVFSFLTVISYLILLVTRYLLVS